MAQSWWPIALLACVGGSFALWYALDDWERARYFGLVIGAPVTVFALVGFVKWHQEAKMKLP